MPEEKFHDVHAVYDGYFNTASGLKIFLQNPDPDTIIIEDIAEALAKICRFGGNIKRFYSVATHSIVVAKLVPEHLRLAALLHDASEAYLGDVIKPLKVILGDKYAGLENRFMMVICAKFGIEPRLLDKVKPYDKEVLTWEHRGLQLGQLDKWYGFLDPLGLGYLVDYDIATIKQVFLRKFDEYRR